jgi:AraC family transcriptional regulator of arabinose operon
MAKMADYLHDSAISAEKDGRSGTAGDAPETPAPSPGIMVANAFRMPYGYRVIRHSGTRDWLLAYTQSGKGFFRNGDTVHECCGGDAMLLAPGTPHDYGTAEDSVWEFVWVHFIPRSDWSRWFAEYGLNRGARFVHIASEDARKSIVASFRDLIRYSAGRGVLQEELAFNALEKILLFIAQSAQTKARPLDPRVEKIVRLFTERPGDGYDVNSLSRLVSLSPSRLAHLFKEQTGESVMETLLKIRMRKAAKLLEFTTLPVGDIARDVGFSSPYYFTRQFTAFYGMSPTLYRRRKTDES